MEVHGMAWMTIFTKQVVNSTSITISMSVHEMGLGQVPMVQALPEVNFFCTPNRPFGAKGHCRTNGWNQKLRPGFRGGVELLQPPSKSKLFLFSIGRVFAPISCWFLVHLIWISSGAK